MSLQQKMVYKYKSVYTTLSRKKKKKDCADQGK